MVFNNSENVSHQANHFGGNLTSISKAPKPQKPLPAKNMSLNAPMINRVHNAKPGCSACGKKVA